MKKLLLFVLLFGIGSPYSFSQEITFQQLQGFEDENHNTQLYYVQQLVEPCEAYGFSFDFISSSDIFHFNTSNSSDSLRFFGTRNHINTNGCYIEGYDELVDFQIDASDSNFVINIKTGTPKYFANLILGSMGMYHPGLLIRFLKHPYSIDKFLFEYQAFQGNLTKELSFQYKQTENPADSLYFGEDLGYRFLNPSTQRVDSIAFLLKSDTLLKTKNMNLTSEISLENVLEFIDSENDSLEIRGNSYLDIYHANDSDLIYWFVDLKDSENNSIQTYLLKNTSKGEIEEWESYPLFTDLENNSGNANYYAISSDSVLYASTENSLFQSLNAGDSFETYLSFDFNITGIYAKPNSSIIYVLTEKELFKIEAGQLTSIKQVPVSNEETPEIPTAVSLKQNYPNPFNPTTTIQFDLDKTTFTKLTVYDVLGRKVQELVNEVRPAGTNTIQFDATNLASGIYLYRLEANGVVQTKRLTLIK